MSIDNLTAAEIIEKFEQQVDDSTELATTEELELMNRVLFRIYDHAPWAFLRREATGTLSSSTITLPAGFDSVLINGQSSDYAVEENVNGAQKFIFTGPEVAPEYQFVNFADRKTYANKAGFAWVDIVNGNITLSTTPQSAKTYSFDYKYIPNSLLISETPLLPNRFRPMIWYGMAVEDDFILRFPKEKSYASENNAMFQGYMQDLAAWNARLELNN